jgi:hypothetical protein
VTGTESPHTPDLENASDFLVAAGLRFTHVAAGRVEGVIDLGPEHHQPWGARPRRCLHDRHRGNEDAERRGSRVFTRLTGSVEIAHRGPVRPCPG